MKVLPSCSAGEMNHWKTLFRMTTSDPLRRSAQARMLLFTTLTLFSRKRRGVTLRYAVGYQMLT